MSSADEKYMQVALRLAKKGTGSVEPNPAVGCIIVRNRKIIGRGWHKKFGAPHAEINAIADCAKKSQDPAGAVMYVTLEPCCHEGKTAPCTDAIIEAGLGKVVAAMADPSQHAAGKGIEKLRTAGIETEVGLCENQAGLLNAPFIKFASTGKCWVILKWAQSIDGKMAWADDSDSPRWISNELSRKDAHKLRRRVGAILVGIATVLADDPLLTPRPSKGKKPVRIVLDSGLRIPLDCKLLATAKKTPALVVTGRDAIEANPQTAEKIRKKGAEILAVPITQGGCDIKPLLDELSNRGIAQLLVEGGAEVITSFLVQSLADEVNIYISPQVLAARGATSVSSPMEKLVKTIDLNHIEIKHFGDDVRIKGLLKPQL